MNKFNCTKQEAKAYKKFLKAIAKEGCINRNAESYIEGFIIAHTNKEEDLQFCPICNGKPITYSWGDRACCPDPDCEYHLTSGWPFEDWNKLTEECG